MNSFFNSTKFGEQSASQQLSKESSTALAMDGQQGTAPAHQGSVFHIQNAGDLERQRQAATFLRSQLEKSLEERLTDAGLLSNAQLILLHQDQFNQPELTVDEILRLRGWFKDTTLNFFIYLEQALLEEFRKLSIGQRLKYAGLVDDTQLDVAIEYKRQTNIRMGHAIFLSGILDQITVDYFVQF